MATEQDIRDFADILVKTGTSDAVAMVMATAALKAADGETAKQAKRDERADEAARKAAECDIEVAAVEAFLADGTLEFTARLNAVTGDAGPEYVKSVRIDVLVGEDGLFRVSNQTVTAKAARGTGRSGVSPERQPTASEKTLMRVSVARLVRNATHMGLGTVRFGDLHAIAEHGKGMQYFRISSTGGYSIHRTGVVDEDGFRAPPSVFTTVWRFLQKMYTLPENERPWVHSPYVKGNSEADCAMVLSDWLDVNEVPAAVAGDGDKL